MYGLGTLINAIAIVVGGLVGLLFGNRLNDAFRHALMNAGGLCCLFIGISGTLSEMILIENNQVHLQGTMMIVITFVLGTLLGCWLNLQQKIEDFGVFLRKLFKANEDSQFINAFVVSSLTVCIGAMAIVGAIQDALAGDISILVAKSIMDAVVIMIFTASLGKGAIFSAIPVFLFQGSITALAVVIEPFLNETVLSNISMTGSMLIFCVGVNLIWGQKFPVANMLPVLLFAAGAAFL